VTSSDADAARSACIDEIRQVFARAGAHAFMHVRELGTAQGIDLDADAPVALASVVKIVVAVAFARAVTAGVIDPRERVRVPAALQIGGTGTAGCDDPVEMSLRDLALFMMSMSDNAATDVIYERVGNSAIEGVLADLGLERTRVLGDMGYCARSVVTELGLDSANDLDSKMAAAGEAVWGLSLIDPERANSSTARDVGLLLEAIWDDRAGTPQACSLVRSLMSHQITGHRLASGFPDGVVVASKTGTLPAVRNEAGVVAYPDGRRYAAAVFTRAASLSDRQPAIDSAIGTAAALAVRHLRELSRGN